MSDYLIFAKNLSIIKVAIIIIYIDDFFFFRPNIMEINIVKLFLTDQYKIKDLSSYG